MTILEKVCLHLKRLPEEKQSEVLDFVEYLEARSASADKDDERKQWSAMSLDSAMRGIAEEHAPYETSDIKETF
ncbi:MAG: DUF2281 domain-containing protein [Syntrophorhabdus aromaticivorans]|jgi:hypothetical protein|uniref:DUF2281 domain-containing protein n=1 Tax=Syntrophorhabdus aromaticivorans TaxID=328301 RepID=A0A971M6C7_9BACT|nr:DUF2281 domain-containing protein [Syntrophorhabdus aromaticivorans]